MTRTMNTRKNHLKEIKSPCIKVCTINNEKCIGCGRTKDEIKEWFYATDDRKIQILERLSNG